jgi:hypothetical protein
MNRDAVSGLLLLLLMGVLALIAVALERSEDQKVCRHTIQRNFGASREEAERMIELERAGNW